MYKISKEFTFSAAHHLPALPDGHKCKRPHGHNYTVIVHLKWETLDQYGFVLDYGELSKIKQYIDEKLDHRDLNDWMDEPSAEILAKIIFDRFKMIYPQLYAVTVKETDKTEATYEE